MFERGREFVVSLNRANWTPHASDQKDQLRQDPEFHLFRDSHKLVGYVTIIPHFVELPVHEYWGKGAKTLVLNAKDREEHEEVEKAVWGLKELGLKVEGNNLKIHPVERSGKPVMFKRKGGKEEAYHVHSFKVSQGSVSDGEWEEFLKGMHFEFMVKQHEKSFKR